MSALLYIPWFRATPWHIPLPFELPGIGDSIPIQPFGMLVAIGVLLGAHVAEWYGKRNGIAPHVVNDMVFHVVVAGFVISPFFNAALYDPETLVAVAREPSLLLRTCFGLSSFGGFFGAMVGLYIWWRKRRIPVRPVADAAVFALPFGWLFGRTGCFVVHDHPGAETDFFLAVYPWGGQGDVARHDLGLYEVFWSAAVIVLLLFLSRKRRPAGFYSGLVPVLYAPVRFFLDSLRAPPELGGDVRYLGLTPGQYSAIVLLLIGVAVLRRAYRDPWPKLPEEARYEPPEEGGTAVLPVPPEAEAAWAASGAPAASGAAGAKAASEEASEGDPSVASSARAAGGRKGRGGKRKGKRRR